MSTTDYRRVVTTQAELDQALADGVSVIDIRSEPGVWLTVRDTGSAIVRVWGSSTVEASGSATLTARDSAIVEARDFVTVRASGSATVRAWGSASVAAWGSVTVRAWGSVTVEAWDYVTVRASGSSTVRASDSVTVRASDSVTVEASDSVTLTARDSATVEASGSVTVEARDSVTVRASGSSTVEASGSVTVRASDSVTVRASSRTAVHLHSDGATITGGVVIDHTQEPYDPMAWCAWHDVPIRDGKAVLHKAVGDDWTTGADYDYRPAYAPGAEVEAPDWRDDNICGGGLHFSPRTWEARSYHPTATRFVVVEVDVNDLRPILGTPKAKAPRCRVLHEVDIDGDPVGGESDE